MSYLTCWQEKSLKLPAFAENVAKMFKWDTYQTSQSIRCEWKKGYILGNVNKLIISMV